MGLQDKKNCSQMGTKLEFCYIHYQRFTAQEHNSSSSDAVGLNF